MHVLHVSAFEHLYVQTGRRIVLSHCSSTRSCHALRNQCHLWMWGATCVCVQLVPEGLRRTHLRQLVVDQVELRHRLLPGHVVRLVDRRHRGPQQARGHVGGEGQEAPLKVLPRVVPQQRLPQPVALARCPPCPLNTRVGHARRAKLARWQLRRASARSPAECANVSCCPVLWISHSHAVAH